MASSAEQAQVILVLMPYLLKRIFDIQTLTCAQLANTWQGDAPDRHRDMVPAVWYNGLAKKQQGHRKGKEASMR